MKTKPTKLFTFKQEVLKKRVEKLEKELSERKRKNENLLNQLTSTKLEENKLDKLFVECVEVAAKSVEKRGIPMYFSNQNKRTEKLPR